MNQTPAQYLLSLPGSSPAAVEALVDRMRGAGVERSRRAALREFLQHIALSVDPAAFGVTSPAAAVGGLRSGGKAKSSAGKGAGAGGAGSGKRPNDRVSLMGRSSTAHDVAAHGFGVAAGMGMGMGMGMGSPFDGTVGIGALFDDSDI